MRLKVLFSALTLLQVVELKVTKVMQWELKEKVWGVAVDEPRFEEEKYVFASCDNNTEKNAHLQCTAGFKYHLYDDVWYNKRCDFKIPITRNSVNKDFRITSMGNDNTIISFSASSVYETNRIKQTELNRIDWQTCKVWEKNRIMRVGDNAYGIIPYADSFDYINKANQTFDNNTLFRISMNDANYKVGEINIMYYYEKPESYLSLDVYPVRSDRSPNDYFLVYDFGVTLKVFTADASGKVKHGKKIFQKYLTLADDYHYRDVHCAVSNNRILICGNIWYDETFVSQCTVLDEKLDVKWEFEYTTKEAEQLVDVKILKSDDVALVSTYPTVEPGKFHIHKVDKSKQRELLHEYSELEGCNLENIKFGKIYDGKENICFSTYCKEDSAIKKWSVNCLYNDASSVAVSTALFTIVTAFQIFNYLKH